MTPLFHNKCKGCYDSTRLSDKCVAATPIACYQLYNTLNIVHEHLLYFQHSYGKVLQWTL